MMMSYEWSIDAEGRGRNTAPGKERAVGCQGVNGPVAFSVGYERPVDAQIFRVDSQGKAKGRRGDLCR